MAEQSAGACPAPLAVGESGHEFLKIVQAQRGSLWSWCPFFHVRKGMEFYPFFAIPYHAWRETCDAPFVMCPRAVGVRVFLC